MTAQENRYKDEPRVKGNKAQEMHFDIPPITENTNGDVFDQKPIELFDQSQDSGKKSDEESKTNKDLLLDEPMAIEDTPPTKFNEIADTLTNSEEPPVEKDHQSESNEEVKPTLPDKTFSKQTEDSKSEPFPTGIIQDSAIVDDRVQPIDDYIVTTVEEEPVDHIQLTDSVKIHNNASPEPQTGETHSLEVQKNLETQAIKQQSVEIRKTATDAKASPGQETTEDDDIYSDLNILSANFANPETTGKKTDSSDGELKEREKRQLKEQKRKKKPKKKERQRSVSSDNENDEPSPERVSREEKRSNRKRNRKKTPLSSDSEDIKHKSKAGKTKKDRRRSKYDRRQSNSESDYSNSDEDSDSTVEADRDRKKNIRKKSKYSKRSDTDKPKKKRSNKKRYESSESDSDYSDDYQRKASKVKRKRRKKVYTESESDSEEDRKSKRKVRVKKQKKSRRYSISD